MPGSKTSIWFTLAIVLGASHTWAQESIEAMLSEENAPAEAAEAVTLQDIEAQIRAREYDYPIQWLHQQIGEIEHSSNRYDARLIRPLTLLGDAQTGKGDYTEALDNYQRAVHLSRVNDGLNSAGQIPIVYREANAYKALGSYKEANDREEYAFHVLSRAHDPYDAELLPGVFHLAEWYRDTNNIFAARSLYEQAVNILSANNLQASALAIPAYQGIAHTYRLERFPPFYVGESDTSSGSDFAPAYSDALSVNNFPAGERALQQIIEIHRTSSNPDPVVLAEAILDLADWYLLFDKTQRAFPLYEHVYQLLSDVEGFAVANFFAEPKILYFPAPQDPRAPPPELRGERRTGFVEVGYEVSKTGYAKSLRTINAEPEGLMDFRVRKSLRLSRYRPMLIDGQPVDKPDHVYRHEFAYFPKLEDADESAAKASSTAAKADEAGEGA